MTNVYDTQIIVKYFAKELIIPFLITLHSQRNINMKEIIMT